MGTTSYSTLRRQRSPVVAAAARVWPRQREGQEEGSGDCDSRGSRAPTRTGGTARDHASFRCPDASPPLVTGDDVGGGPRG